MTFTRFWGFEGRGVLRKGRDCRKNKVWTIHKRISHDGDIYLYVYLYIYVGVEIEGLKGTESVNAFL